MNSTNDTKTFHEKWEARIAIQCSCCFTNYTFDEMMNCHYVWVDDDEKYGKVGICNVCGKKFHESKWGIKSFKDNYIVYTTHLEMPQVPPNFIDDIMDAQYFWESMIENTDTGEFLDFQARYKTQKDAEDGHWLAYDNLEDMILNPEKYPQGLMGMFFNAMNAVHEQRKTIQSDVKDRLK